MKVVYIAGKFSGANSWETECNIRRAEEAAFDVAKLGAMPLCPHTNTRFFDGTLSHGFWYRGTLELLYRCDALYLVDNWRESTGARNEEREARNRAIPISQTLEELAAWLATNP